MPMSRSRFQALLWSELQLKVRRNIRDDVQSPADRVLSSCSERKYGIEAGCLFRSDISGSAGRRAGGKRSRRSAEVGRPYPRLAGGTMSRESAGRMPRQRAVATSLAVRLSTVPRSLIV